MPAAVVTVVELRAYCPTCGADNIIQPNRLACCAVCARTFVPTLDEIFVICPNPGCSRDGSDIFVPEQALRNPGQALQCGNCNALFRLPGREARMAPRADQPREPATRPAHRAEDSGILELPALGIAADHRPPSSRAPAAVSEHPASRLAALIEGIAGAPATDAFLRRHGAHGSHAQTLVQYLLEEENKDERSRAITVLTELLSAMQLEEALLHAGAPGPAHSRTIDAMAASLCRHHGYLVISRPAGAGDWLSKLVSIEQRVRHEHDLSAVQGLGGEACRIAELVFRHWVHFHASQAHGSAYFEYLQARGWLPRDRKVDSLERIALGSLVQAYAGLTEGDPRYAPDPKAHLWTVPPFPSRADLNKVVELRNQRFSTHAQPRAALPTWQQLVEEAGQITLIMRMLVAALTHRALFPAFMVLSEVIRDRHRFRRYRCLMDDGERRDVLTHEPLERDRVYLVSPTSARVVVDPHIVRAP